MKRGDKREVSLRTILPVVFPTYTLYDLLFIVMFDMGVVEGRCFDQWTRGLDEGCVLCLLWLLALW